jgi:hypothetical protein
MKAIQIKYLSATNTKGARLKASTKDGQGIIKQMTEAREYGENVETQAEKLAQKFINEMGWNTSIMGIGVYDDSYYVTIG